MRVTPSGLLPSNLDKPDGSKLDGTPAVVKARWRTSLMEAWRWYYYYYYYYYNCSEEELFYEQVLPAVTNMLQSHTTIRLLRIVCGYINKESSQPNWIELVQHLYETIFIHPSLEYIEIDTGYPTPPLLVDTLKDQKKTLIDRHRKEQPHKPLPIVNFR